ncbi:MAG TPA: DUF2231 domain-containing protein [Ktedonobacterales bacterium]|jgi:uncharacterized membrane protein|nr:DUF2231 domain-containing protein [Ktedonobacterales bacterium]
MPAIHPVEFHPLIVHFPIALLILSVIFDFLGVFLRRWGLTEAATWMLVFGTPSAGVALLSGWVSEHYVTVGAAGDILHLHKVVAVLTTCLFSLLLFVRLVWLAPRGFALFKRVTALQPVVASADGALRMIAPKLYAPALPRSAIALYLALSVVAVGLLGLTGYLGGALVYDHGVGAPSGLISILF